MKRTLIVIDMQNDFIDGSLGTKEAEAIVDPVRNLIQEYKNRGDEVIYTRDTHGTDYMQTNEGRHLPVEHCIKGTAGWEIADGIYADGCKIIDTELCRQTHGAVEIEYFFALFVLLVNRQQNENSVGDYLSVQMMILFGAL